ncbi:anti-sigma factor domain-containing protein [Streptomyces sp. NPDC058622]|uniref:anti-sigma factor n=1 Tax=Streptomyces sp. NPDC058622 TaxID=3346562 RepID=UPI003661E734
MSTESMHGATGAYAANALPAAERAAFEAHLETCPPCAREVRELAATVALLGRAVAVRPPPELFDAVMRRVRELPAEPSGAAGAGASAEIGAGDGAGAGAGEYVPPGGVREAPGAAGSRTASEDDQAEDGRAGARAAPAPTRGRVRHARPGRPWLRWALAASLAAVAGLGGVAVWQAEQAGTARQDARRAEARAAELAEVLAAPDAKPVTGKLANGGTGTVVVSEDRNRAVFVASGMPAPPTGQVYQLWFADPAGSMRPAGLMDPARPGAPELMTGPVSGSTAVGVTLEPAGGSPAPTTEPLMVLALPAPGTP